jgi:predicted Na+-dependent transporter
MAAGGIAATVFTYMATGNWGWAIVALLASGVVLNFIGQLVVQPIVATRTARHHGVGPRASR